MSQKKTQKAETAQTQESQQAQQQKKEEKRQPVDIATYNKYIDLKFLELSGEKLKDEAKKEMLQLEADLKKCKGDVPKKTVTAAINNEVIRMVQGVPLPYALAEILKGKKCKNTSYYL
jgi:hypothetical protein